MLHGPWVGPRSLGLAARLPSAFGCDAPRWGGMGEPPPFRLGLMLETPPLSWGKDGDFYIPYQLYGFTPTVVGKLIMQLLEVLTSLVCILC